jgi:predicted HicB family RNase H-like nuclease
VELETPRRLSRVISVRFDPEEAAAVEQNARRAGLTMSAYVRQAALGQIGA